jgi:branched-chain amino acid transport system permease protein
MAAGKNVRSYKISMFVVSSMMASVAGVMYAHYVSFVDPSSVTVMESIFILAAAVLGGCGRIWSPALGSVVLIALPEILRMVGISSSIAGNVRQILFGVLLVAFMMWRPQGLIDEDSASSVGHRA